jgi:hypothetical protein
MFETRFSILSTSIDDGGSGVDNVYSLPPGPQESGPQGIRPSPNLCAMTTLVEPVEPQVPDPVPDNPSRVSDRFALRPDPWASR